MGEFNNQFYLKVKQIQALSKKSTRETYLNYFHRVNETVKTVIKDCLSCNCSTTSENQDLVRLFFASGLEQNEVVYCAQNLETDTEMLLLVWPLMQNFKCALGNKSLICRGANQLPFNYPSEYCSFSCSVPASPKAEFGH